MLLSHVTLVYLSEFMGNLQDIFFFFCWLCAPFSQFLAISVPRVTYLNHKFDDIFKLSQFAKRRMFVGIKMHQTFIKA